MKPIWLQTIAWLAAVAAALALAFAAPSETNVMGRLPAMTGTRLDHTTVSLPDGLPAARTLTLIAFTRTHRGEIDSWIQGLQLHQDTSIAWMRMPVLNDPGSQRERKATLERILERHPGEGDRARLMPVFTDRDAFVRTAGLSGIEHAGILVIGRNGRVLARVEGQFDETKAQALRETLLARNEDN